MPTEKVQIDNELKSALLELSDKEQKRILRLMRFIIWKRSGRKPVNTTVFDLVVGAWIYFTEYQPSNQALGSETK